MIKHIRSLRSRLTAGVFIKLLINMHADTMGKVRNIFLNQFDSESA